MDIYGFYKSAVAIMSLRIEIGQDSNERDYENEHLITDGVPLGNFLFATSSEDRNKFNAGLLVPNLFHSINSNLPSVLTKEDVLNEEKILSWLIKNNGDEATRDYSVFLYSQVTRNILEKRLNGDTKLANVIQHLLEDKNKNTSRFN
jgi:hypothetical protein